MKNIEFYCINVIKKYWKKGIGFYCIGVIKK